MPEESEIADFGWFDERSYSDARKFSKSDWYFALRLRDAFISSHDLIWSIAMPVADRWSWYLENANTSLEFIENSKRQYFDDELNLERPVVEIERADEVDSSKPIPEQGVRALLINPDAPDDAILREFVSWMTDLRKEHPFPFGVPSKKALNAKITAKHIDAWMSHRILQVIDVDTWAMIHGKSRLHHDKLCELLMGQNFTGIQKTWGIAARKQVKKALGTLESLANQASTEESR